MYSVAPQVPRIKEVFGAKGVRSSEREESVDKETFRLKTTFEDVDVSDNQVSGRIIHDVVIPIPYRGKVQHIRTTMEANFVFDLTSRMRPRLFVFGGDQDTMMGILNATVFKGDQGIAFTAIAPTDLVQFTTNRAARILWASFKGLNIPNLNKSALWGADLSNTQDYQRYCQHGENHYVMIELQGQHWVVSVGSDGKAIMYSKVSQDDFLRLLKSDVVPILR